MEDRYLEKDLLGADVADGLDEFGPLRFGGIRKPGHGQLDHIDLGFFGLAPPVHEVGDLFVEFVPLLGLAAEGDLDGGGVTMSLRTAMEVRC